MVDSAVFFSWICRSSKHNTPPFLQLSNATLESKLRDEVINQEDIRRRCVHVHVLVCVSACLSMSVCRVSMCVPMCVYVCVNAVSRVCTCVHG